MHFTEIDFRFIMNKLKLFLENFLIYGIGGIISKIIPLIMVPLVTRLMPNSDYYGISDLSNTVISFGSALAVMGMYDAMYRMFSEKSLFNSYGIYINDIRHNFFAHAYL